MEIFTIINKALQQLVSLVLKLLIECTSRQIKIFKRRPMQTIGFKLGV